MVKNALKNKGKKLKFTTLAFTLIELLAVIVILAIIALIAIPIILGIINDSKQQATLRSAEMYLKAVNNSIVSLAMDDKKIEDGAYQIIEGGNICLGILDNKVCTGDILEVEIDGEVPIGGKIYLDKSKVTMNTILEYQNGAKLIKNEEGNLKSVKIKSYDNGDIVYFDVVKGKGCSKSEYESSFDSSIGDYLNSSTGYNGIKDENDTSNKNSCLKFYAFSDDGVNKVNLLLDHNTTPKIAWVNSIYYSDSEKWVNKLYNSKGPLTALNSLYNDTKNWNGTIIPKDYTMDQSTQTSGANYTIKYSEIPSYEGATTPYKARLITAQEIAQITGKDKETNINWNEVSSSNAYAITKQFSWLYDRSHPSCKTYGCPNNSDKTIAGYWTSSSVASSTMNSWYIKFEGPISYISSDFPESIGVRPVIEVLKSNL